MAKPSDQKVRDAVQEGEARMSEHMAEKGVQGIADLLERQLTNYETLPVKIGITGKSGSGKSSLVNTMRNMTPKDKDKGPAEVGVNETTMECKEYRHPELPNVKLWDLPGVGTPKFPKETYITKVSMLNYDALILCNAGRFTEDDVWIAKEAKDRGILVYFVRTKIDQDIESGENDYGEDEATVIKKVKSDVHNNLREQGLHNNMVFLISTRLQKTRQWDYPRFQEMLIHDAPPKNKKVLIHAMIATSKKVIYQKKDELMQRIPLIICKIILDNEEREKIFSSETRRYLEQFGLTEEIMKSHGVSSEDIKKVVESLKSHKKAIMVGLGILGLVVATIATGGVALAGVGLGTGAIAGGTLTTVAGAAVTVESALAAGMAVAAAAGTAGGISLGTGVSADNVTLETAEHLTGVKTKNDVLIACQNILGMELDLEKRKAMEDLSKGLVQLLEQYAKAAENVIKRQA